MVFCLNLFLAYFLWNNIFFIRKYLMWNSIFYKKLLSCFCRMSLSCWDIMEKLKIDPVHQNFKYSLLNLIAHCGFKICRLPINCWNNKLFCTSVLFWTDFEVICKCYVKCGCYKKFPSIFGFNFNYFIP